MMMASELGVRERSSSRANLTICHLLGAGECLSGKYDKHHLDETQFAEHDIEVRYQGFRHSIYPQLCGEFLSSMSAIDLLLNCGDSSVDIIAQANSHTIRTEEALARM